jgi:mannose-6-phosphate isomerase-like protein (cupin superfamily)
MQFIKPKQFTGTCAWDSLAIASMNGITAKLHWTDQPYQWHVNDGQEVFVVLDGVVNMHYRQDEEEKIQPMMAGDIFYASEGTEHVAKPIGEARVLVIETEGSI